MQRSESQTLTSSVNLSRGHNNRTQNEVSLQVVRRHNHLFRPQEQNGRRLHFDMETAPSDHEERRGNHPPSIYNINWITRLLKDKEESEIDGLQKIALLLLHKLQSSFLIWLIGMLPLVRRLAGTGRLIQKILFCIS